MVLPCNTRFATYCIVHHTHYSVGYCRVSRPNRTTAQAQINVGPYAKVRVNWRWNAQTHSRVSNYAAVHPPLV